MSALVEFWRTASDDMKQQVRRLFVDKEAEQKSAVDFMVAADCVEAAPIIAQRLRSASPEVTDHMLQGLWALSSEMAEETAMKIADSGNSAQAGIARRFLLEQHGVMKLVMGLSDADPAVHRDAAQRLASLPERLVAMAMRTHIMSDRSPEVVRATLETFGTINPRKAFDAARALFKRRPNPMWPKIAAEFLVKSGPIGWHFLLKKIRNSKGTGDRVQAASEALVQHRYDETMADAESDLQSNVGLTRAQAALVIGALHGEGMEEKETESRLPHVASILAPLIDDPHELVRRTVIWAMGELP